MASEPAAPPGAPDAPEALVERFQAVSAELERIEDPLVRARASELVGLVIDLYGEGLRRIFATLEAAGESTEAVRESLAADGVVASLMLVHDLYPVELEQRVEEALDSVRPYMASHGGDVELLGVSEEGVATIRLAGSCDGCPASAATLELAIKQALDEHAPDLEGLVVEGGASAPAGPRPVRGANGSAGAGAEPAPSWFGVAGVAGLEEGSMRTLPLAGRELLFARVEGSLLAYLDECAGCGSELGGAALEAGVLRCSACGCRYSLPRAGRSLDGEGPQLAPVPLLVEDGAVKVALPG